METIDFCKSLDFMKLGQAINRENWQIAVGTLQRMQKKAGEAGCDTFDRNFIQLKQCLMHKEQLAAKNILALIIAKRAQILNSTGR